MNDQRQGFGKILLEMRKRRGLTQPECANLFRVSSATITLWERGKQIPTFSNQRGAWHLLRSVPCLNAEDDALDADVPELFHTP